MVSPGKPRGWTSYCSTRTIKIARPSVLKNGYTDGVRVSIAPGSRAYLSRQTALHLQPEIPVNQYRF